MAVGKILVVGYGSVGRRHTKNLQLLGCDDLIFLRSGRPNTIDQVPPPGEQVSDLSDALAHDVVAAIIATPSAAHLDTALPLAKHGCHLFIEKPVTTDGDIDRCEQLIKIAREKNLVTMVGCQFRFHPLLKELREGLRSGRIGTAQDAHAQWGEYLPDWHPWENHRQGYAAREDLGGGVMLTLIHPIDYLYWLFGETDEVQAEYGKLAELQTRVPDDWAKLKLRFKRGVSARVDLDYIQRPAVHRLSVRGSNGNAKLDFNAGELVWTVDGEKARNVGVDSDYTRNDMFVAEMKHFLDCVAKRIPTELALEEGLEPLRTVAKARQDGAAEATNESAS